MRAAAAAATPIQTVAIVITWELIQTMLHTLLLYSLRFICCNLGIDCFAGMLHGS